MGYLRDIFHKTEEANRQAIEELLETNPRARLLDLGCFDGELTQRLADKIGTSNLFGVEILSDAAQLAVERGISVISANLNQPIPLPSESFDVIHANQVIEHLYDTDIFLAEIARLLTPDGYAILSTNNLCSLHNIVSLLLGKQPPPCHISSKVIVGNPMNPLNNTAHDSAAMSHLRIFSHQGLKDLLQVYGLRPEVYITVGFYPLPPKIAEIMTKILPIYGAFLTCKVKKIRIRETK